MIDIFLEVSIYTRFRFKISNLRHVCDGSRNLEYWAAQLCVIQNTSTPSLDYARLLIFAGDHGVVAENVTSYPSAVTASIFATIAAGKAASSVIAASQGIEVEVIDVGIASDVSKFYSDIAFNAKVCIPYCPHRPSTSEP
jgi:NaMN:DMB phosphoribosyltransferase